MTRARSPLTLLRELPGIDLHEDESVACYGIRCDPPNMMLKKPFKIRIPHSSVVINPDQVKPDIVSRVWDPVKDIQIKLKHMIVLPMKSRDEDQDFPVTIMITQSGKIDISISLAFVIRCSGEPGTEHSLQPSSFAPVADEVSRSDLQDIDVRSIADKMTVDQYYDLGVALGFRVQQLDVMEYNRFWDRQHAFYDMLKMATNATIWSRSKGKLALTHEILESSTKDLALALDQHIPETLRLPSYSSLKVPETVRLPFHSNPHVPETFRMASSFLLEVDLIADGFLKTRKGLGRAGHHQDIVRTGSRSEISDKFLVEFSRKIKGNKFFVIGERLGLTKRELEHIQHKTLFNRTNANIRMLSKWKASQTSEDGAVKTLKRVWESVQSARTVKNEEDEDVSHQPKRIHVKRTRSEETHSEPEIFESIFNIGVDDSSSRKSETQNSEYLEDLQLHGGQPEEEDIRIIALQVTSLPLAHDLGKALRVGDDIIVGFIDLSSPSVIRDATLQVIDSWLGNMKEEEREEMLTQLLSEYNILNAKAGREEISKIPQSTGELLQLCQRIDIKASFLLEIISGVVTFPAHVIRRIALKMLIEWLDQGGTRERLLEVAQAFRFNDAALKIAEAMESRFPPFISHGIMDHRGVKLFLDKLGIIVTIPEGAIPKGMRSVATLQVRTQDSPRIPVQQGEVLISPVIETSLTQELIKPASVVIRTCINPNVRRDDSPAILCTKTGQGNYQCLFAEVKSVND
nr:uncharacterized protein LOC129263485 [Lytechinus pictus]